MVMKTFDRALKVGELYEEVHKDLDIEWIGGRSAADKEFLESNDHSQLGLIGYFNMVHTYQVNIIGSEELEYLSSLSKEISQDAHNKLFNQNCCVILFCGGCQPTAEILAQAERCNVALLTSQRTGEELLTDLHYYLSLALAPKITLHGVFMEVISIGVLLAGDSGVGKSELALELISRGHRLITDDAPIFTRIAPDIIEGASPPTIQDFLEVRGLGILNIRKMYGNSAIKKSKYLRLIINLKNKNEKMRSDGDRLRNIVTAQDVLGLKIPVFTLPVAPGRNLAVLIEAAVINHSLRINQYYAEDELSSRQSAHIESNKSP